MAKYSFLCATCGISVVVCVEQLPATAALNSEDMQDMLPRGTFAVSEGELLPERKGDYLVNLNDLQSTKHHHDYHRLQGCCGLDGCDGFNLTCTNGHEIGTERSDCWMPHRAILSHELVKLISD